MSCVFTKPRWVENYADLKNILSGCDGQVHDFWISLAGGAVRSSKEISYDEDTDTFYVTHMIDGHEQELKGEEILSKENGNIGEAIAKRAFAWGGPC